MKDWGPEQSEEQVVLVQKTAKMLPVPAGQEQKARRGFFKVLADIGKAIKGYTADDIGRLKEGGVQKVEGEGQKAIAEAQAKVAEAAKLHAEAELKRAEAELKRAEVSKAKAEAYATARKADGEYAKDVAAAWNSFQEAQSRIKQAGGSVSFDFEQIFHLLCRGEQPPEKVDVDVTAKLVQPPEA